ncbi:MAG: molybdenum cofactor guanylyltransferase MobA [Arcobacteraceae bacterium]|jgi:molybdopterin-guanine dinucleotide biosynthesis protein A|nr:molybdenum cofactor guanylyltransferase MobA [Arcobacteraceae bacterium]
MIETIPCIILSGGKSSRMGEDKSLLSFGGFNTLIEYQHHKLSKIFSNVYISSKINKFDFFCNILYDTSEVYSPMVALQSILQSIEEEKVFIISVDTPLVEENTIYKLIKESSNQRFDVTICKDLEKTHNLIGVFHKNILKQIDTMLQENNHKINTLLTQKVQLQIIPFEKGTQFVNINTKEDYLNLGKI